VIEPVHDVDATTITINATIAIDQFANRIPDMVPTSRNRRSTLPIALNFRTCSVSARSTGSRSIDDAP